MSAGAANAATSLELGLAIDASGSIGTANFNLQKNAYINALSDASILPTDGTVAIGVYRFASTVTTIFPMQNITTATLPTLIAALTGMAYTGGSTNISGAITTAQLDIFGNAIVSARQVIDVSTDGENNIGNLATARANALTAGIDQINCIGIGSGANCAPVQGGTGSFSLAANDFDDFEVALRRKITREVQGSVPEPSTWFMMIAGFGMIGFTMRRRSTASTKPNFI